MGLNCFITTQGFSTIGMLSVLIGAVLNIALDPLFIFGFGMGVQGAAIATVISQACSAAFVTGFLLSRKSILRFRLKNLRIDFKLIGPVLALGLSPFIMQSTESLVNITLNASLQHYGGDLYVGAMTIIGSVMQMILMPMQGLTQGAQPIISYNFGALQFQRDVYKRQEPIPRIIIHRKLGLRAGFRHMPPDQQLHPGKAKGESAVPLCRDPAAHAGKTGVAAVGRKIVRPGPRCV